MREFFKTFFLILASFIWGWVPCLIWVAITSPGYFQDACLGALIFPILIGPIFVGILFGIRNIAGAMIFGNILMFAIMFLLTRFCVGNKTRKISVLIFSTLLFVVLSFIAMHIAMQIVSAQQA